MLIALGLRDVSGLNSFGLAANCAILLHNFGLEDFVFDALLVHIYTNEDLMKRQSISITEPNDTWLKAQLESKEYSSISELVNDLIRQARAREKQIAKIRSKLVEAEQSGFIQESKAEIRNASLAKRHG
jgi:antitoxin ParD1/3/4